MAKQEQHSIIEPTEEELVIYRQLITDIPEDQIDELANEFFQGVKDDNMGISFPRFLIDKFVRPIQPGDTINIQTEDRQQKILFCLVREIIDNITYLLFAEADPDSEDLKTEFTYLFYVCRLDSIGMEEIDIMSAGEETERILDILEAQVDVKMVDGDITQADKQE